LSGRDFVGRTEELTAISACVDAATAGSARTVWIEGAAGSGKTALLRRVVDQLPAGFNILRAEADELATDTARAVVAQLAPIVATDGFGAGLELLQTFGAAQDDGPLAVVVEDLHWADVTSRQALLTAARRLRDDRVVMIITSRPQASADDGWERLVSDPDRSVRLALGPLTVDEVAQLGDEAGVTLTRAAAQRLHRHTEGHPLHVRTLLVELTPAQLNAPDGALPAPRTLASTTIARMADVTGAGQRLASALAVVNHRVALDVVARVASVDQPTAALESLLTTRFVMWAPAEVGTPVEFVHPLYRAAIYDDLSPTRRQELHLAAAALFDGDVALTHRVAAADHIDEALAGDLTAAAHDQADHGALALAARSYLWAASFTADRDRIDENTLAATHALLTDGQIARSAALRPRVESGRDSPTRRLVLGMLAAERGDAPGAVRSLADVATIADADGSDSAIVSEALARLGTVYTMQDRGQDAIDVAIRSLALDPADREIEHRAWTSLVLGVGMVRGAPAGLDHLSERLPADVNAIHAEDHALLVTRGTLGFYAGRTTAAVADLRFAVTVMRRGPDPAALPRAHLHLAQLLMNAGDWDDALVHARVAASLAADDREIWIQAPVHAVLGTLLASRGEWGPATARVQAAREAAADLGTAEAVFTARIAEAALARARAVPEDVVDALAPLAGDGDSRTIPMFSSLGWWSTLVGALVDSGDLERAEHHGAQLERAAGVRGLDFTARLAGLRAQLAMARGHAEDAGSGFARTIVALGPDDPILDRANIHHRYGQLLHARGRRREAVDQLRAAHELLAGVGAAPFLERLETDLQSAGIGTTRRADRSPLELTDRETDVVALVARGLTNREVAGELYVSTKAVEYHLRNVFGKLGISSRRELRDRVPN